MFSKKIVKSDEEVAPPVAVDPAGKKTRKYERIRLARPIVARLGSMSVVLWDLSIVGARIEHNVQLATGTVARLSFRWNDHRIEIEARVVRSKLERFSAGADGMTIYHSGLQFVGASPESAHALQKMITSHIVRALKEQRANAYGLPSEDLNDMPTFRKGVLTNDRSADEQEERLPFYILPRQSGFVCFRFDKGHWKRSVTNSREQPADGFTISTSEDAEQVQLLCRVFAIADAEGRRLTRLFAQLSVTEGEGILPGRFEP